MTALRQLAGWLLGLPGVTGIEQARLTLAASWANQGTGAFWLWLGIGLLGAVAAIFYLRLQTRGSRAARLTLAACRGLLLALLLLTLAEPVLQLAIISRPRPLVYVLLDGTESMAIEDPTSAAQREALAGHVELPRGAASQSGWSRLELVRGLLRAQRPDNVLARLEDQNHYQLEAFVFDGRTTSRLRRLAEAEASRPATDWPRLAEQLTTTGQVTALGNVLADIPQQSGAGRLAAVVLISDFAHNSGPAPLGSSATGSLVERLGVPLYTVGVGATEVIDLAADLQTDPKIRKGDETSVKVRLRQTGLTGREVLVRVTARPEASDASSAAETSDASRDPDPAASADERALPVGQRQVTLEAAEQLVEFPYTPQAAGRFRFEVQAEPLAEEVVSQNNVAWREANIIDDYVRLMYVAYEPSWEWRFVKEVFHRDKTVGMDGFRTYLASSDPRVRESNPLFLPTLTPQRSEFFANDVIFLDDMPAAALTPRFCELVQEFVGQLGGGLVVIAGPRFGPGQLAGTALSDMLPVVVDRELSLRDDREFPLRRTPLAELYPFMRLGRDDRENQQAWDNLGPLPWYQPVAEVHVRAEVLAEHPRDTCRDGRTPQPLIAIRRYGEGEVVYLAFNELWRLRKRFGERYYRDFWSSLIDRLGLSHDLGRRKRFVPRLDREQYRVEDTVTLTVQAYDENYSPLAADDLQSGSLEAELRLPDAGGGPARVQPLTVPLLRDGLFELRLPVYVAGSYQLRVKDPLTGEFTQRDFEVADLSAERRSPVRELSLQEELARQSGGRSYDLTTVGRLAQDMHLEPVEERVNRNHALWTTPLWFLLLMALMLGEWLGRKWVRLT